MKSLKLLVLFCSFCISAANGQVVTYEPAFPTSDNSLTVTFDATQGNGELEGFQGDVYLHTGVITSESTNESDWQYVPFGWNTHDPKMKATPLGDNKWEFTYSPSIRQFFEISNPNVEIKQIAIVFKGVQGGNVVAEGKDTGNSDIFIDMTSGGASARFLNPSNNFEILSSESSLEIVGVGSVQEGNLTLSLEKDGVEVQNVSTDSLFYSFTPETDENDVNFDLIASNGEGLSDTASVFVTVKDNDGELVSRPAGLEDGVSENGSSVTLSLFAPQKDYVYVIGNFNNWTPSSEYLMNKEVSGNDSTWFWLEVDGFTSGEDVIFQYLVDGEVKIADPYSELVLDPWNDGYIEDQTFSNIPDYPANGDGLVSWHRFGAQDYEWQINDFEGPEKDELIIYELLLRDFLAESNYSTLIDTLDHLENLGINAIELMPINEFDGNLSWGYNPALHLALDKYYGTPEDFKRFVDEAHSRGIAVIVDLVLNHATDLNPLYKLYERGENPYFNMEARHAYNVFNDINHQYSGTQYYVKRTVQYWIEEYNIDGFRWDLTKGFTQNCTANDQGCTGRPQSDRIDILQKYADYQWEVNPDFYVIFEHLGDESEEKEWANYRVDEGKGILLWGNMNYNYNEATMGYNNNSNLTGVLSESRPSFQERHLIGYMESHDEERLMYKNLQHGASSGNYDTSELNIALNRMQLAAAFFLPLPGPKMIWQFGELGYDVNIDYNGRTGDKPIRWIYFQDENRKKLYKTYAALLDLRHASEAFTSPESIDYKLSGSYKWVKLQHEDSDVIIIGNFGTSAAEEEVTFTTTGTWYNYFEGNSVEVDEVDQSFHLEPGEFRIFTTKKFESPEEGILTGIEEEGLDSPLSFNLHQNYPNPFNPSTVISYQLAANSDVQLEVFDMVGRKVATLVNGKMKAGEHQVTFNAQKLASGVYIYRLKAGEKIFTQKMTLIK